MSAFGYSRGDHEASWLHADRTLSFLVCTILRRRLRVDDLNYVLPLNYGAWVIQVLNVALLLFSSNLCTFLDLLCSFF